MTSWRLVLTAVLLLALGLPLAMPFLALVRQSEAWRAWEESQRLFELAVNTFLLVSGTLALALPAGIVGAVLLYRTDLPLRKFLRAVTVLTLFVPLPLFASAWQAALGSGGWLPVAVWTTPLPDDPDVPTTGITWEPWAQGIGPAVWVHAVAGLPWIVWLVGQGLCWVERELEEDALLVVQPWQVLWHVTLPRARVAVFAAGLWVALQTATEITVTDMMQVRTFAEEVYVQFVRPEANLAAVTAEGIVPRAVAVSVPVVLLSWLLVVGAARRWERTLPPLETQLRPPYVFRLGRWRGPILALVLVAIGFLAGVPLAGLVWKAGLAGSPEVWSGQSVWKQVALVWPAHRRMLSENLVLVGAAGAVTATLALVCCWLATESRWFYALTLGLAAAAWALPGPVIGIGLKETIDVLIGWTGSGTLATVLYYGPSPAPVLWAFLLRFFPCAVALLWPVVRLVPRELRDAARVDGAGPVTEFRSIIWPLTAGAALRAGLAVAVLALGELSAGKLAATPGSQTFAHVVFEQMHWGVPSDVAALCLVLLLIVTLGGLLVAGWNRWLTESNS